MFDPKTIKTKFPIFKEKTPLGQDLVYLDNAATCHKPQSVIDAIADYYAKDYSTVGRASYWPASNTTRKFNHVRKQVRELINAAHEEEVVFTFGTTDGINKLANAFLRPRIGAGDQVIISEMEHHANLLPWQQICHEVGAELLVIPMFESGALDYQALEIMINDRVKLVAVTAISNALGVKNDIGRISEIAHAHNVPVLVDAAQSLAHEQIDVQALDCDFMVFSGHKLYGPTGVGVLYGKRKWLDQIPPLSLGGGIVKEVRFEESSFQEPPHKHEAGTPNIAGVLGLGAALTFIQSVGYDQITEHTEALTRYAVTELEKLEGVRVIGSNENRAPAISFVMEGVHPHDLSTFLNEKGICIRAGHHCAQPLMQRLNVSGTARISFAVYNTEEDVDALIRTLKETKDFLF